MALRMILKDGDPALRKISREVTRFDDRLHTMLDDMRDTLADANGMGLAAPQVGVLRQVVVVDIGTLEEPAIYELINPRIVYSEGSQRPSEGCLSVPGLRGYVDRPLKVKVEAFDRFGNAYTMEGEETVAQLFSHEIDHLHGILFIDKPDFEIIHKDEEEVPDED